MSLRVTLQSKIKGTFQCCSHLPVLLVISWEQYWVPSYYSKIWRQNVSTLSSKIRSSCHRCCYEEGRYHLAYPRIRNCLDHRLLRCQLLSGGGYFLIHPPCLYHHYKVWAPHYWFTYQLSRSQSSSSDFFGGYLGVSIESSLSGSRAFSMSFILSETDSCTELDKLLSKKGILETFSGLRRSCWYNSERWGLPCVQSISPVLRT